jgi:hypothetical protein
VTVAKLEAPTWLLPPGELVESRRHDISESQWSGLVGAIEAAGFWRLETSEKSMMNDGDPLIVEARRGEVYHITSSSACLLHGVAAFTLSLLWCFNWRKLPKRASTQARQGLECGSVSPDLDPQRLPIRPEADCHSSQSFDSLLRERSKW